MCAIFPDSVAKTWGPGHSQEEQHAVCPLPKTCPWRKARCIISGFWKCHLLWHQELNTVLRCASLLSCETSSSFVASFIALWSHSEVAWGWVHSWWQCDLCYRHTAVWIAFHNYLRTSLGRMWEESCVGWIQYKATLVSVAALAQGIYGFDFKLRREYNL